MEMGGQLHASDALPLERAHVPLGGGWVGPRVGVDGVWQSESPLLPLGIESWIIQPVESCCTDQAVPPPIFIVATLSYKEDKRRNCS
jgi:hypothetical protein